MSLDAAHVLDGYEVMGSAMNRWSPYVLTHPENHYRLFVHGTRHAEVVWFSCAVPGAAHLPLLFLAGGMIETFGGLLLLIGLFTRPVAFILSGEMAVAYFKFHAPQGFWPLLNDAARRSRVNVENATHRVCIGKTTTRAPGVTRGVLM